MCRAAARSWDASHLPQKRVAAITVIYDFHEIPPPGVRPNWPLKIGQHPMYTYHAPK